MRTALLRRVLASIATALTFAAATPAAAAPALGLARDAGTVTNNNDGTFTVQFTVTVSHVGDTEDLDNVDVRDTLSGSSPRFGTWSASPGYGEYTIGTAPAFSGACLTLSLNGGFDGSTTTQLASGTLAVGGSCRITYAVRWFPASQTSFTTQSIGTAEGAISAAPTSDLSDNGLVPDANGNGNAGDAGENDTTTVSVPAGSLGSCGTLYASRGATTGFSLAGLRTVDPLGGSISADFTQIPLVTTGTMVAAIAVDPSTRRIWYVERRTTAAARFGFFDPATNVHTVVANTFPGTTNTLIRLAISQSGIAYALDDANVLYSFVPGPNPTVTSLGAVTFVGTPPSGITGSGDFAFDQAGRGWAIFGNNLYALDTGTLTATVVGQLRLGGTPLPPLPGTGSITGLAFDGANRMYVTDITSPSQVYRVNLPSLDLTLVASTADTLTDLASCTIPPPVTPPRVDVIKSAGTPTAVSSTVFDVPYTVTVASDGGVPAPTLQVNDYLPNTFSSGAPTITIPSAPTVTSGVCTANAAFNGTSDTRLLAGTDLLSAGTSCRITFTVRLTYASVGAVPSAVQNNSAYASSHPTSPNAGYTYPGGTPTAPSGAWNVDQSTNGSTLPGTPNGDAPSVTLVTLVTQRIDVVKAAGTPVAVSATVFDVPYTVRVGNLGTSTTTNVQVNDYLPNTFASGSPMIAIQAAPSVTAGGCTANGSFNGSADTRLLAGTDTLAASATCTITFTVRLTYASAGVVPATVQNNTAYASTAAASNAGYTFPGGTATPPGAAIATDVSTSGSALPGTPNGDSATPTPVTLPVQRIDVVKAAGSVSQIGATVFDVPYTVRVGNLGTVTATNVQVNDYLPGTFASGSPTIAVTVAPAVTAGSCTANAAFNGNADTRLLAGSDALAASANCTITFTVRLTYASVGVVPSGTQNNTARASTAAAVNAGYTFPGGTATPPGGAIATDQSTNGSTLPGTPNADSATPTPVTLTGQRIDVVKAAGSVSQVSPTVFDVPYTVRVGNVGTVTATNVHVNDYLPGTFASGSPTIAIQVAPAVTAGGCTANPSFNGSADTRLLAGTNALAASATCTVTFTARLTYASVGVVPTGVQNNTAWASTAAASNAGHTFPGGVATPPVAALATDQSSNGGALPGTPNGDSPTPTPLTLSGQRIDVVKAAGTVTQVGTTVFDVPYTVRVGNLGGIAATNVQVNDYLPNTFASGSPTIAIQAAPAVTAGGCTPNASFNGNADTRLLAGSDALAANATCTITFTVRLTYASVGVVPSAVQNNTAYASAAAAVNAGWTFPGGTATAPGAALATDASSNAASLPGTPGGDAPGPTPVTLLPQRIDVVKAVGTPTQFAPATFDVPYTVRVGNRGTTTTTNVQVNDHLPTTFASGSPTVTIAAAPAVTAGSCTPNPSFNGNADTRLLTGTDTLAAGASCTITFTARVAYPSVGAIPTAAQTNTAHASTATATNAGWTYPGGTATAPPSALATDVSSDASALPSSPGGDVPGPTPVTFTRETIDIVLSATSVTRVATSAFDVRYTARVGNGGTVTATNVQASDYLPAAFVAGTPTLAIAAAPSVSAGGCTANAAYNGSTDTRLLAGTDALAAGAVCTIAFTVRVTYPSVAVVPTTAQNDSAYASTAATGPNVGYTFPGGAPTAPVGALATDQSTDAVTLPGTPNGDTPGPTPVTWPATASAALSGYVWIDANRDRVRQPGESVVGDFGVEIVNAATGAVVGCTSANNPNGAGGCVVVGTDALFRTSSTGQYQVTGLVPGSYRVRFRDPANTVVFTTPVNGSGDAASRVDASGQFLNVTLAGGATVIEQSLPIDPAGVVYDATTRQPVPGATVAFCGPSGFDPTKMLVGTGYGASGACATMVTGTLGAYQFILNATAPAGTYTLAVTPPAGYVAPSLAIPPQPGSLTPPTGPGAHLVQAQPTPPAVGQPTPYWLTLNLAPGVRDVLNNHLPVDPVTGNALFVAKTASAPVVELGDSVAYTISVRNPTGTTIANVVLADTLPHGFRYIARSVRVNGLAATEPQGAPGPLLRIALGALASSTTATVTYRLRVGVGAQQGDGVNRAAASGAGGVTSNVATAKVVVSGGVFTTEACVVGKVFVDCNGNSVQDREEIGIPGVRMYFSNGTWLVSDIEGKYSYCGLEARTHTFKVDRVTLPRGSRLVTSSNRNALDPGSLFLDLKAGELHQADFIEGSCSAEVMGQVKARRAQGEVRAPETEKRGGPALTLDSKPGARDTSDQRVPKPRYDAPGPVRCRTESDCDRPLGELWPSRSSPPPGGWPPGGGSAQPFTSGGAR